MNRYRIADLATNKRKSPSASLPKKLLCLTYFMVAKIGRKPNLSIEIVIVILDQKPSNNPL